MATEVGMPKSPLELYRIAKKTGMWDPESIPVAEDLPDWQRLDEDQREQLLRICALFYEGEVSVSDTLAWWLIAMPEPARRVFLATQIFEEVKHADFFAHYFRHVLGNVDTRKYLNPLYRSVLVDGLRARGEAIGHALLAANGSGLSGDGGHAVTGKARQNDDLERALILGMAHYMGIIEGTLAASGYDYFEEMLGTRKSFPRLLEGIRLIRTDEGRHIVHGMDYLRQRLAGRDDYKVLVAQLFFEESMRANARADFVFERNGFNLDRERMIALSMEHLAQRSHEIGLA
ncbi:MAG: ribonucleotide-diphosphate reductase subunit beta [Candidatus Acidiferrales bacterium]